MSTILLLKQMLMLFAMMVAGYITFRRGLFDTVGQHQISKLIVNLLNPFLLLSALSGDKPSGGLTLSLQNLLSALIYYVLFVAISYLFFLLKKGDIQRRKLQQLMLIFSNLGFFGVPVVKALFGDGYVIYLIFYMLFFNLIAYTLGIFIASGGSKEGASFSPRSIVNIGTVISIVALILYFADVKIPETAASFCTYMGNACIPLSMILIGGSLAQLDLKAVFSDLEIYLFSLLRMIVVPAICILIVRNLPFDPSIVKICCLVISMPIATLAGMLAEQYAGEGNYCNKMTAMTTVMSVITVPLLSLLYL